MEERLLVCPTSDDELPAVTRRGPCPARGVTGPDGQLHRVVGRNSGVSQDLCILPLGQLETAPVADQFIRHYDFRYLFTKRFIR